jgi:hypothetical protein
MLPLLQGEREVLDNSKSAVHSEQSVLQEHRAALQRHVQQLEAREASVAAAEASLEALRQQLEQQQAELAAQAQRVGCCATQGTAQSHGQRITCILVCHYNARQWLCCSSLLDGTECTATMSHDGWMPLT